MGNTTSEILTVESLTQFGPRINGKTYSISPRLKDSGVSSASFQVGKAYQMEIWTGPQGGKSINSFVELMLFPP